MIGILLAPGFEEIEAVTIVDTLRRAHLPVNLVSTTSSLVVLGAHQIQLTCDLLLDATINDYEMIVLPGGMGGTNYLKEDKAVLTLLQTFDLNHKKIGAICAGPLVLKAAGILRPPFTAYPGLIEGSSDDEVVLNDQVLTSKGPATSLAFSYALLKLLGQPYQDIMKDMLYK